MSFIPYVCLPDLNKQAYGKVIKNIKNKIPGLNFIGYIYVKISFFF